MTKLRYLHYTQLGIFLLLRSLTLVGGEDGVEGCPPPSVPVASTYLNVTKGLNKPSWKIKYVCDKGKIFKNFISFYHKLYKAKKGANAVGMIIMPPVTTESSLKKQN